MTSRLIDHPHFHGNPPSPGGNGGGGAYVAKAVTFDGTSYLSCPSVSTADSPSTLLFSMWVKFPSLPSNFPALWGSDPNNAYNIFSCGGKTADQVELDMTFTSATVHSSAMESARVSVDPGIWLNLMQSVDTQSGVSFFYVNDVDGGPTFPTTFTVPFDMTWNGTDCYVGLDFPGWGDEFAGDMADLQVWIGTNRDLSITANRRLFIDDTGKPVNPSVAAAELGAPTFLFSGDHSGFATNQGTGGAFTLTGTLTDASTSPSA